MGKSSYSAYRSLTPINNTLKHMPPKIVHTPFLNSKPSSLTVFKHPYNLMFGSSYFNSCPSRISPTRINKCISMLDISNRDLCLINEPIQPVQHDITTSSPTKISKSISTLELSNRNGPLCNELRHPVQHITTSSPGHPVRQYITTSSPNKLEYNKLKHLSLKPLSSQSNISSWHNSLTSKGMTLVEQREFKIQRPKFVFTENKSKQHLTVTCNF